MKGVLWAMVFLIIGGLLGGFMALGFGVSVGVASGLVQGAQAGTCVTVETAGALGLIGADDQDALIRAAITAIRDKAQDLPGQSQTDWVADTSGCAALIAALDPAAGAPPR